jgi:hypothetical protein
VQPFNFGLGSPHERCPYYCVQSSHSLFRNFPILYHPTTSI